MLPDHYLVLDGNQCSHDVLGVRDPENTIIVIRGSTGGSIDTPATFRSSSIAQEVFSGPLAFSAPGKESVLPGFGYERGRKPDRFDTRKHHRA